ncbi:MAG: hypothetical protein FJZ58_06215, partial [Chlamydiae bacterium]|nr:hypothetical protein [Chlamydiota bacterium]
MMLGLCFVACHGGAANHMTAFIKECKQEKREVHVFASGPAADIFAAKGIHVDDVFTEDEASAKTLAERCSALGAIILYDVGATFDIWFAQALQEEAPQALRIAYYDNLESFVPGGYTETAAQVIKLSTRVLFANANLAEEGILSSKEKALGIGYYPLDQVESLKEARKEQDSLRA